MIPFWCLMPKGEKLRPKQEMDQLPLKNLFSLVGRMFDYGKKGEFLNLDQFLLEYLSLCLNK
jgi:hypothetical protein